MKMACPKTEGKYCFRGFHRLAEIILEPISSGVKTTDSRAAEISAAFCFATALDYEFPRLFS
jgi:hypothetical protein